MTSKVALLKCRPIQRKISPEVSTEAESGLLVPLVLCALAACAF